MMHRKPLRFLQGTGWFSSLVHAESSRPITTPLSPDKRRQGLRYLVIEGAYASVLGTVTGGAFLTGFALSLGARDLQIGILASLPILANMVNVPASYMLERTGLQRTICLRFLFLSRSLWLVILLLPILLYLRTSGAIIGIFLGLVFCQYILEAIAGLAWISWVSDLVPKEGMGKYFSRRNVITGSAGLATGMIAGQLLDHLQALFPRNPAFGFSILLLFGLTGGMISLSYLSKIAEVPSEPLGAHESLIGLLTLPLKQIFFRRLMWFRVAWDFSTNIATPFFSVYMIRDAGLSYSFIGGLAAISGLASLSSMRFWGSLSDRIGNKSILQASVSVKSVFPLLWILTGPRSYLLFIGIHLTGAFDAGLNLSMNNLLLKLAPKEKHSVYFAIYFTASGLIASFAPVTGALLAGSFEGKQLSLSFLTIDHLKLLFLVSAFLRILCLLLLHRVVENPAREAQP